MTIVTHDFKVQRFLDVHLPACRWPRGAVQFKGIDPPENVTPRKALDAGEARRYVISRDRSPRDFIVRVVVLSGKKLFTSLTRNLSKFSVLMLDTFYDVRCSWCPKIYVTPH